MKTPKKPLELTQLIAAQDYLIIVRRQLLDAGEPSLALAAGALLSRIKCAEAEGRRQNV